MLMATARAFIFAAEEDFGIVVVEAQSEGTPVLALGRGGARESVSIAPGRSTGMFFDQSEPNSIAECVRSFVSKEQTISRLECRRRASLFSPEKFRARFMGAVTAADTKI